MIPTWRERILQITHPLSDEEVGRHMQGEINDLRAVLATLESETIERCVQLCLLERDEADLREPDPPGSTMNADHISGQSWMANSLAKKLQALTKE